MPTKLPKRRRYEVAVTWHYPNGYTEPDTVTVRATTTAEACALAAAAPRPERVTAVTVGTAMKD